MIILIAISLFLVSLLFLLSYRSYKLSLINEEPYFQSLIDKINSGELIYFLKTKESKLSKINLSGDSYYFSFNKSEDIEFWKSTRAPTSDFLEISIKIHCEYVVYENKNSSLHFRLDKCFMYKFLNFKTRKKFSELISILKEIDLSGYNVYIRDNKLDNILQ